MINIISCLAVLTDNYEQFEKISNSIMYNEKRDINVSCTAIENLKKPNHNQQQQQSSDQNWFAGGEYYTYMYNGDAPI